MEPTEPRRARLSPRALARYCYLWLMVGFATGTLVLVGPVRWLTAALRSGAVSQEGENAIMIGVIVVYVIASALLTLWLFRRAATCRTARGRLAVPAGSTVVALACLWLWLNPATLAQVAGSVGGRVTIGDGAEFVFGPYPDRAKLEQLKREGFTAVVSLQHPAVLPFEPPGIAEEQRATREIGITFVHAPMLPWVSANDEALDTIRGLARSGAGRYYVHCGLGRDRANVVKRMLEREGMRVAASQGFMAARTFAQRRADRRGPMERGTFEEIDRDVWLIPYPNKHELFSNMLSGQFKHVLLLLDPRNTNEKAWLDESMSLFRQFHVPFRQQTVVPAVPASAEMAARLARDLERPLAVVVPFMPPQPSTEVADVFLRAYRAQPTE